MASDTKHRKKVIKKKLTKKGKSRKRRIATNGTTPRFCIHPEDDKKNPLPTFEKLG